MFEHQGLGIKIPESCASQTWEEELYLGFMGLGSRGLLFRV